MATTSATAPAWRRTCYETYAVTAVAVMLLGILTFGTTEVVLFPLVLGGVSIVASIIGTFAVKSADGQRRARASTRA